MKIMLIMTGGTICSEKTNGVLSAKADNAVPVLVDRLRADGFDGVEFDVRHVLDILSENMTFARLNRLLSYISALGNADGELDCDGIIIAHGTDTLAYTSSLLALALAGLGKPVFIVSSNYTLDRPEANGHANMKAAVTLISRGFGAGVYVPYRNSDGVMYIHHGAHLVQCANYSSDFYSSDMKPMEFAAPYAVQSENPPIYALYRGKSGAGAFPLKDCVMKIDPYVGIDYSVYKPGKTVRAVLHGSYHSSTACAERSDGNGAFTKYSALYMLQYCKKHGLDFWLCPIRGTEKTPNVYSSNVYSSNVYSSTADLLQSGAKPVMSLTNETAYMKLSLAYSLGFEGCEVDDFMSRMLASEKI